MSRIANNPVVLSSDIEVKLDGQHLNIKGAKGALEMIVHDDVEISQEDSRLTFAARGNSKQAHALSGTTRALVNNMVKGVTDGFEKRLQLQGVGYRAQAQGDKLNLQLGFSHPIEYTLPKGIKAETPSQTEIIISGMDNQLVGQVSAEIRAFRPPEPYKGKGVRYADERVRRKEAKKK